MAGPGDLRDGPRRAGGLFIGARGSRFPSRRPAPGSRDTRGPAQPHGTGPAALSSQPGSADRASHRVRETDQQGLTWPLAPNRFLPLPPNETLVLSFASVPDGRFDDDEVQIRARLYMISTPPRPAPGVGCPWELRADAEGRIDLFAAKPVRGPR